MICASSHPIKKITKDTGNYMFTDKFNITDKTNLVWRNFYNINNKVIDIYHEIFKIIVTFEK